jgi:hypothetical protein
VGQEAAVSRLIFEVAGFEHIIHMTVSHDCFLSFSVVVAIVYLFWLLLRTLSKELLKSFVQRATSHLRLICRFPCIDYIFYGLEVTLVLALISPLFKW